MTQVHSEAGQSAEAPLLLPYISAPQASELSAISADSTGEEIAAVNPLHIIGEICTRLADQTEPQAPVYQTPSKRWPGVFEAMCLAEVRPDGIDIADAKLQPGITDEVVAEAWTMYRNGTFGTMPMRPFAELLFDFPVRIPVETVRRPDLTIDEYSREVMHRSTHIANLDVGSQIGVGRPIQAPGGRYDVRAPGEGRIFNWDSLPTAEGAATMGEWGLERISHTLDNFTELADKLDGNIPNVNATWAMDRPQPNVTARLVRLEAKLLGTDEISDERLRLLETHLEYWDRGARDTDDGPAKLGLEPGSVYRFAVRMPNGHVMYRFHDNAVDEGREWRDEMYLTDLMVKWELEDEYERQLTPEEDLELADHLATGAAGGEDYTPDESADFAHFRHLRSANLVSVKQSALTCDVFNTLAYAYYDKAGNTTYTVEERAAYQKQAIKYEQRGQDLADCINQYCIGSEGLPANYDFVKDETLPGKSMTGIFALSSGVIGYTRGREMLDVIDQRFALPGGFINTLWKGAEPMNWGKNAWPIMELEAIHAAVLYGRFGLAIKWCDMLLDRDDAAYDKHGCLFEKYDPNNPGEPGGGGEYDCIRDLLMSHGAHLALRGMREWLYEQAQMAQPAV